MKIHMEKAKAESYEDFQLILQRRGILEPVIFLFYCIITVLRETSSVGWGSGLSHLHTGRRSALGTLSVDSSDTHSWQQDRSHRTAPPEAGRQTHCSADTPGSQEKWGPAVAPSPGEVGAALPPWQGECQKQVRNSRQPKPVSQWHQRTRVTSTNVTHITCCQGCSEAALAASVKGQPKPRAAWRGDK